MSNTQPHSNAAELDWLAFRYVTGELRPVECEAFELQLGEDQSAREAVAAAVRLHTLLRAAVATSTVQPRRSPIAATLQRLALLAASCGSIAYVGSQARDSQPPAANVVLRDDLATAWAGVVDVNEIAALRETPAAVLEETSSVREPEVNSPDAASASETAESESLSPPLWMLAALDAASTEAATGEDELEVESPSDAVNPPAAGNEESPDAASPEARRGRGRPEGSGASISPPSNWMQA